MIKVGIIGYGLSGRIFHGAIINAVEGFEIKKIVTRNKDKKKQAESDIEDVTVVDSSEDVFQDTTIDLVVISTPNTMHFDLAKQAMEAGKHVVIEKPFTVTSQEGQMLLHIANQTNRVLSVYQNRRFDSDFKTVKKIIESGELGRLVEFESHFDRFRPDIKQNAWREDPLPGSGILYDLGAHLIDQALALFGMPDEVYGDVRFQRHGKVDDNFEVILYYPELKVTLKSSALVKEPLPRFILQGTKGGYIKYGLDVQEDALRDDERPVDDAWGTEPESLWGVINTIEERRTVKSEQGDYRDFYRNVYNAIIKGEELAVKGQDGLNVIKIIEAVAQSNKEKRRVSM